jgi:cyclophilin family peptidyl-prolyl cis-trans isomerase
MIPLLLCLVLLALHSSLGAQIQGVILTTGKDTRAFEKSIVSSLKHLVDVDKFYIIAPGASQLDDKLGKELGERVKFIDESIFPFDWRNISEVMIESVREKGVYPLTGKSQFETTVWGRIGWFLQQLLKFYAGRVLNLGDYVLLDSDIIWFKDTKFINETHTVNGKEVTRYYYASSSQYHAPYMATLKKISGVDLYKSPDTHRSGIAHHMVIVKSVLEDLMTTSEQRYGGLPFWKVLLNERYTV